MFAASSSSSTSDGWEDVDHYLHRRGATKVSHGVCPDCARKHYGEFAE